MRVPLYKGDLCKDCFNRAEEAKKKFQSRASAYTQPFEKFEELPAQAMTSAQDVTCYDAAAEKAARAADKISADADAMCDPSGPDLPEDLDRPFVLAGIAFEAAKHTRQLGGDTVSVRKKHLSIHSGAIQEHGLARYTHARLAASRDGQAIAIKFYTGKRPGALKFQRGCVISGEAFLREHPGMVGREGLLEAAGIEGWYVVRLGKEVA
jgi:hypothetical protein